MFNLRIKTPGYNANNTEVLMDSTLVCLKPFGVPTCFHKSPSVLNALCVLFYLVMACLMTLSVDLIISCRIVGWLVNSEVESMFKKAIVSCLEVP